MPKTLVPTVGSTHVWRSLKTADHNEAARLGRIVGGDIERSFDLVSRKPVEVTVRPRLVHARLTVEQAFEKFLSDPGRERAVKTSSHYVNLRAVTSGLWGEARLLESLGRDDCRRLLDVLRVLPTNAAKRFPTLSFAEIIEKAE